MWYLRLRDHGDDVISHVSVAIKDVLAHWKNSLLSIQKQITSPDAYQKDCNLIVPG